MARISKNTLQEQFDLFRKVLGLSTRFVLVEHDTRPLYAVAYVGQVGQRGVGQDVITPFVSAKEFLDQIHFAERVAKYKTNPWVG